MSGGVVSFEVMVRHASAEAIVQRLLERVPPRAVAGTPNLRWGKPSTFKSAGFGAVKPPTPIEITIIWPDGGEDDDNEDPPPGVIFRDYYEVSRATEDIRIENPDDSEDWVMFSRTNSITFQGPDADTGEQVFVRFHYDNG